MADALIAVAGALVVAALLYAAVAWRVNRTILKSARAAGTDTEEGKK